MSLTLSATCADSGEDTASTLESRLILIFEADRPLASSTCYGLTGIHTIRVGRGSRRVVERIDGVLTVRVPDRRMSSQHAEFQLLIDHWRLSDCSSRNGCFVDGKRVAFHALREDEMIELGHTMFAIQHDCPRSHDEADGENPRPPTFGLRTLHVGLQHELIKAAKLSSTALSFLIQGESGTGKEVMARALHTLSGRRGAFIGVNTAALPASLVESELFGHQRGAFSGAVSDQIGLIRSADKGTLFLDEIGDLPLSAQAILLRVLQEREVRPVGGTRAIPIDIHLLSATHKELALRVEKGEFRQDLYARIAGIQIHLPPLRERRVDLGIVSADLLPKVSDRAAGLVFSMDAVRALFRHDWPMNIRELGNCLLTAAALTDTGRVERAHLSVAPHSDGQDTNPAASMSAEQPVPRPAIQEPSKDDILASLTANDNNITHAARALGLSRQGLHRRMERFDIPRPSRKD